jgi:hypothetical protein
MTTCVYWRCANPGEPVICAEHKVEDVCMNCEGPLGERPRRGRCCACYQHWLRHERKAENAG